VTGRRIGIGLGAVLLAAAVALTFGAARWRLRTRDFDASLRAAKTAGAPRTFDPREIESLPAPVRRYLQIALRPGQPAIESVRVTTEGEFLLDVEKKRWAPFTADQLFTVTPPAFDWDARIRMLPGLNVFVRDAYRQGEGLLRVEAAGIVKVANVPPSPDLARGELLRWLAEAAWFPTALLPSQGVRWEAVAEDRALATIVDRGVEAKLEFRFGPDGLPASVFASDRARAVGQANVPTPWEATWSAWGPRNGMRVPSAGEVAWLLPEGRMSYYRGRVKSVAYAFSNADAVSATKPEAP
jgi:hypothetical protein